MLVIRGVIILILKLKKKNFTYIKSVSQLVKLVSGLIHLWLLQKKYIFTKTRLRIKHLQ